MKLTQSISLFTIMALATGCGVLHNNTDKTSEKTMTPAKIQPAQHVNSDIDIAKTFKGEWSIIEVNGEKVVINGEDHPKLTLTPSSEEQSSVISVIGFNGCNYLNGMWTIKGNKISPAGEFLSSLKSCADAPYEFSVNQAINNVDTYRFSEASSLDLISNTGRVVMKLRKHDLGYLNGAWRVTAIERQAITASIKIVIDIEEKRIHGNAGCNLLNGDITVNLDKGDGIEFKNLATSRMTCPDIATEQAFLLALESVDTAAKGPDANHAMLLNDSGQEIVALTRLSPDEIAE